MQTSLEALIDPIVRQVYPAMRKDASPETARARLLAALVRLLAGARRLPLPEQYAAQPDDSPVLEGIDLAAADPRLPGEIYARLLVDRHGRGSYYTPPQMADDLARRVLEPLLAGAGPEAITALTILDPAAGSGHFLIAAGEVIAERLGAHFGMPPVEARRTALNSLHGVDRDPTAAELAAVSLWLWAADPALRLDDLTPRLIWADALLGGWPESLPAAFDAVIGNPPFASVFTRARSAEADDERRRIQARYQTARGSFDLSVPFVERALQLCRPGGRCGLVLPNKILAADYAQTLRGWMESRATVEAITDWTADHAFDAGVYPVTCVFRREKPSPEVGLTIYRVQGGSPGLIRRGKQSDLWGAPGAAWSGVFDPDWDILQGCFSGTARLGDLATLAGGLTVGEAYDLRPQVVDVADDLPPDGWYKLVTTRLIRRCHSTWGEVPARYLKQTYLRPAVPAEALPPRRREQAASPKILVAGMGQRVRALVDRGEMQASVATTVILDPAWPPDALCALLNSALIARLYRALYGGLALSGGYLRFARRELSRLPVPELPADDPRLARLAELGRRMAQASSDERPAIDDEIDRLVYALYRIPEML